MASRLARAVGTGERHVDQRGGAGAGRHGGAGGDDEPVQDELAVLVAGDGELAGEQQSGACAVPGAELQGRAVGQVDGQRARERVGPAVLDLDGDLALGGGNRLMACVSAAAMEGSGPAPHCTIHSSLVTRKVGWRSYSPPPIGALKP